MIRNNGLSDRTVVTPNDLGRLVEISQRPRSSRMLFVGDKVSASTLAEEESFVVAVRKDIATKGNIRDLQDAASSLSSGRSTRNGNGKRRGRGATRC